MRELKAAGLLDSTLPPGFEVPSPTDVAVLMPDELPLDAADDEDDDALDPADNDQEQLDFDDPAGFDDDEDGDEPDRDASGAS